MNLYGLFLNPQFFQSNLPASIGADDLAVRSLTDAWMVFIFELGSIGAALLYAARNPLDNRIIVWVVMLAEAFRGVLADAIWIIRGYEASSYIVFIIIHLAIIITGWWFLRSAQKQPA